MEDFPSDWVNFSNSYLWAALRLVIETKNTVGAAKKDSFVHPNYLIIPILFNLKHGIEIYLKTLRKILSNDGSLEIKEGGHDSKKVFSLFKEEFLKNLPEIKKIIKEKSLKEETITKILNATGDKIEETFISLELLVEKYHHLSFLKDKLGENFSIEDSKNDSFRYPENQLNLRIDYSKVFSKISKEEMEEIEEDISKLMVNFQQVVFYVRAYKILKKG